MIGQSGSQLARFALNTSPFRVNVADIDACVPLRK